MEEIPPGFQPMLCSCRAGRVVAAGHHGGSFSLTKTLTSTFDVPLVIEKIGNRWSARLRLED